MGAYIPWRDLYSVGNESIDLQHRQILSIIGDLHNAIGADRGCAVIEETLDRMVFYTMTHFQHEEQLMRACGYPDYENHKALHDKMQRYTATLRANSNLLTGGDLLGFLKRWWVQHIRGEDQRYVPYLAAMNRQPLHAALAGVAAQSVGPVNGLGQTAAY